MPQMIDFIKIRKGSQRTSASTDRLPLFVSISQLLGDNFSSSDAAGRFELHPHNSWLVMLQVLKMPD